MKKNIIIMILSIIFLITIIVIGIGPKELYYKVFYFKDRINISTKVYIDGEEVEIDKDSIVVEGNDVGKKTINIDNNTLDISYKGKQFSLYTIDFKAGEYTFRIGMAHYNWWDVFKFNIVVNVDTKNKTVTYDSVGTHISEDTWEEIEYDVSDKNNIEDINVIAIGVW